MKDTDRELLLRNGLTDEQAAESAALHGTNEISQRKTKGFFGQFISNLGDPMIKVLLGALALNLLLSLRSGNWFESIGIASAVMLAALVSTASEYGSSLAFAKLSEEAANISCRVIRNGKTVSLPINSIVAGDIVKLEAGDMIPCDGILISGNISVDQSALTGESAEQDKIPMTRITDCLPHDTSEKSSLFRGSVVTAGEGIMLTQRVGASTFLGGMAEELQEDTPDSPLKLKLSKLAKQISIIGYCAAILVGGADLVNLLVIHGGMYTLTLGGFFSHLLHAVTLGLTVVVVAVPEGLPMMITVVLSSNMLRMQRDNVMVRKLVGIETAGSLNILFCDKTGTLTSGKLKVSKIILADGKQYDRISEMPDNLKALTDLSLRCNNSSEYDGTGRVTGGNSTDRALLEFAGPVPYDKSYRREKLIPFDSTKKYSSAVVKSRKRTVLIKGAPEKLLGFCSSYFAQDAQKLELNDNTRLILNRILTEYTASAYRVLALAVSEKEFSGSKTDELCFFGFAVLRDEIRPTAKKSIQTIKKAGIHPVMITGDNRETAAAIACELGIAESPDDGTIITSDDLKLMSDHTLKEKLNEINVVARALPSDKSRLVRAARESGLVCGMTGDGVNDAPALKRADVGFAMGSGTAVAKEAGDIVITDNNIASIVKAILYGRTVFKSIRRFIVFQLTMNLSAVGVSLICPFICGVETPVTVMQMLWINIIMDTLAGLAFAGEAPLEEYLSEKPLPKNEPVICGEMLSQIIFNGIWIVSLCVLFLKLPRFTVLFRASPDSIYLLTAFFALFIFCGVVNSFNARTTRLNLLAKLHLNKTFTAIIILICAVQLLLIRYGGTLFRCTPLTFGELKTVLLLSLTVIPADLIRKAALRLILRRSHGVKDGNYRYSDVRKNSQPHICKSQSRKNQERNLDAKRENDVLTDNNTCAPRYHDSIA